MTHDRQAERRVLDVIEQLLSELGGAGARRPPRLDDALDRDLGIGSLERVELLLRIERQLGVRLPDATMAEAATPRELVAAVLAARPEAIALSEQRAIHAEPGAVAVDAGSLVDALRWHAERSPERPHVTLVEDGGAERVLPYGWLWREARAMATGLAGHGVEPGDRVALMLRTEAAFFPAFFGVLLAGATPVPIYPPLRRDRIEEYAGRQTGILVNAGPRAIVTFPESLAVARLVQARLPTPAVVVSAPSLARSEPGLPRRSLRPEDPALIQYTSGSTGDPKGVLLSHDNLLANIRAIGAAIAIRPDDVAVSWLPLYHDMGLIGCWLGSLYWGVPITILSPLAFLARPPRWLRAIHAHRATVSAAPNFAFDLCVRWADDAELRGLDLSSWRLALNGSEPVSPDTIERFTARFAPHGFRPDAMCPVYGLAEASVALTVSPVGRLPRIDRVHRESLERRGRAEPASAGDPAPLHLVACGRPLPGHELRIVDAAGRPVGDREAGRIEFRGPSVTAGYFRNPGATRAALDDGFMDSGDLGYWADGELFVTGRRKDLIIKAGRNLHPQEVEALVGGVAGVRKGCVAAFGEPDPAIGTERLVVVAETRETDPGQRAGVEAAVREAVVAALGIPADVVVVAAPGTVLKTPSGKIRRSATRDAWRRGDLGQPRPAVARQWSRLLAAAGAGWVRRGRGLAVDGLRAAYLGALMAATLPLLWALVRFAPSTRAADRAVGTWCRVALAWGGCPLRLEGGAHLESAGAKVLVGNHASYLDVVALLAALPGGFRFVAKRELERWPVVGAVIARCGHLTVERDDPSRSVADARRAAEALAAGTSLFVFPEGTFVRSPGILPFRLGAFKASVETGRPIVPVGIRGTRDILPAGAWLPRPGPVTITVCQPLPPAGTGWPEMVRLRDAARAAVAAAAGERPRD